MDPTCRHLFVYGTLRQGSPHPMARYLAHNARRIGDAWAPGRLYHLGPYPGLVRQGEEQDRVRGELYELPRPDEVLAVLDRYEGCGPEAEPPGVFRRVQTTVRLDSGAAQTAWVYEYVKPVTEGQRILSGDYLEKG